MIRRIELFFLLLVTLAAFGAQPPAPRDVDITAPDGVKLKATYYAAGKSGPGLMLFHQCNRDRKMWNDLAPRLASMGINVLTLDFRGFGESGGPHFDQVTPQEGQRIVQQVWPGDVDKAFDYLLSQPGVKKDVIGAGGASCGVNQSVQFARRHPQSAKSLVLLSGTTDRDGRTFLKQSKQLPIFGAAADDDQGAVEQISWILSVSPDQANTFQHYKTGGHGIEMFPPHPELTGLITDWFQTTLLKTPGRAPENKNATFRKDYQLLEQIDSGGADEIAAKLKQDPKSVTIPEAMVNILGYEHIQSGDAKGAIKILQLNVAAFPNSPNVYDSLSDAYVADGQNGPALENAKKALELLASDTTDDEARKQGIRQSAEQKVKQLAAGQ
jgi:dienelactone hydrolase